MREYHHHSPSIQNSLHKTSPAFIRYPHEWSDAAQISDITEIACFGESEPAVLEIDEEGLEACVACDLDNLDVWRDFDAEGGTEFVL